jgi:hypothetical protein
MLFSLTVKYFICLSFIGILDIQQSIGVHKNVWVYIYHVQHVLMYIYIANC